MKGMDVHTYHVNLNFLKSDSKPSKIENRLSPGFHSQPNVANPVHALSHYEIECLSKAPFIM